MRFKKCDSCSKNGACVVAVQDTGKWDKHCRYSSFRKKFIHEAYRSTETQAVYLLSE